MKVKNTVSSMRFFRICVKYYKGDELSAEESRDQGDFIHTHSTEDILEPIAMVAAFLTAPIKTLKSFYLGNSKN